MTNISTSSRDYIKEFEDYIKVKASFVCPSFLKQTEMFGEVWKSRFEELLRLFIATDEQKMHEAVEGYVKFVLDGMRLQKRFEKNRQYVNKTYEEAASEVYHNKDYMFSRYLPGLMLSHYLWPHHYRQYQFFEKTFLPLVTSNAEAEFCDIGVGTGFYSRVLLASDAKVKGWAFDISESALEYGTAHLNAYGVADRWFTQLQNVELSPPPRQWPFLINIEVLEHLEDPLSFLKALRNMLKPDGHAFISAAVTAAEKDHIYLYNSAQEVSAQLQDAGFRVIASQEDAAYEPQGDVPVPINAAFIVTTA